MYGNWNCNHVKDYVKAQKIDSYTNSQMNRKSMTQQRIPEHSNKPKTETINSVVTTQQQTNNNKLSVYNNNYKLQ